MSIENVTISTTSIKALPTSEHAQHKWHWLNLNLLRSPLWLCLLFTLLVRIWLIMHNNAILEGDEALVGIQAEHILHGEFPIYFYAQPYMGSLEAYLLALIFAIVGPSSWALRAEPTLLSLIITGLTWKLAGALADVAKLFPSHKRWFQTIAALGATFPPLYDLVIELRTYGGYIETFIITLSILYTTLRLTQRWQAGAKVRELVWRWALLGFLIGLGFWVYPLVIIAVVAAGIWIIASVGTGSAQGTIPTAPVRKLVGGEQLGQGQALSLRIPSLFADWYKEAQPSPTIFALVKGLLPALTAIPGAVVGFAPALYWGALNRWQNITYILGSGTSTSSDRVSSIRKVIHLYRTCTALRVIGGALPTDPGITAQSPHLTTPALLIGLTCIVVSCTVWALSFIWPQPTGGASPPLLQGRRLLTLPLLFAGSCALIFCASSATTVGLVNMCGPLDWAGRYATPLMLVLPFFLATALTFVYIVLQSKMTRQNAERSAGSVSPSSPTVKQSIGHPHFWLQIGLLFCLLVYIGGHVYAYETANPHYTFQTSGCVVAPEDDNLIIVYLQQQHIHYVWANSWVGNPITFKTQSNVIAVDPHIVTNANYVNRIPDYTNAVLHADRPSIIILALQSDSHPKILTVLDQAHITYRTARFPSAPGYGVDALVITPLNHSVSPFMGPDLGTSFWTC